MLKRIVADNPLTYCMEHQPAQPAEIVVDCSSLQSSLFEKETVFLKQILRNGGNGYVLQSFIFDKLTENVIHEFRQYFLAECGFQESTFYNVATHLKTVCRLAYREGLADTLLFDKAKISKGDKKLPKALDRAALDKLKALRFDDLEEDLETARDIFLFACYTGAAYCDLMELNKSHLVRDDEGKWWLKFNRRKTGVPCCIKLLPKAIRLIERFHSDERETLLPYIKYKNYQACLKALRLRAGITSPFTTHTARHTFATLITLEQGVPIETVSKMLGHSNVSMTERYAKVTPQKLFEEFDRFLSFTEDLRLTI